MIRAQRTQNFKQNGVKTPHPRQQEETTEIIEVSRRSIDTGGRAPTYQLSELKSRGEGVNEEENLAKSQRQ